LAGKKAAEAVGIDEVAAEAAAPAAANAKAE
jgi:hypothetical protein